MAEFINNHSMARYDHDVERGLTMFRAGLSQHARSQIQSMWNAQVNDNGKDWVVVYVRNMNTNKLIEKFHVPLNVTADQHRAVVDDNVQRIRNLHPHLADLMLVCHE